MDPETREEHWLAPLGLLNYLCYIAQAYLPRDSTAHSELEPPTLTSHQENASTGLSDGGKFSIEAPSSQVFLGLYP